MPDPVFRAAAPRLLGHSAAAQTARFAICLDSDRRSTSDEGVNEIRKRLAVLFVAAAFGVGAGVGVSACGGDDDDSGNGGNGSSLQDLTDEAKDLTDEAKDLTDGED